MHGDGELVTERGEVFKGIWKKRSNIGYENLRHHWKLEWKF